MCFFLFFLLLFTGQQTSFARDFRFGLGVTIEHPREVEYARSQGRVELHKIYLPVTFKSAIRVIPEVAYWHVSFDFGDISSKYSVLHAGVGLYALIPIEKTNIYFGPRVAFMNFSNPPSDVPANVKNSKTDKIYGGTFGAEYALLTNFSLGFEIQYNHYEINPWGNRGYETVETQNALETVFVIAFHL